MRIRSGGQTGVDRAALDAARFFGWSWGGWAPKGWRAEDGAIPREYRAPREDGNGLVEADRPGYPYRTELNVRDAWSLLILYRGRFEGGTKLTADIAARRSPKMSRLSLVFSPDGEPEGEIESIASWLRGKDNVMIAGPRESKEPGIYRQSLHILRAAFALV